MNFDDIKQSIAEELAEVDSYLDKVISSDVDVVRQICGQLSLQNGKRIRPMLVLLTAKLYGSVPAAVFRAATLIELLHVATLVHDDVVDEAKSRRGEASVNAAWGNATAVLMGDYLLSKCLSIAVAERDLKTLELVLQPISKMSEGEIWQLQFTANLSLSEENYLEIIRRKTAELLAACCLLGGSLQDAPNEQLQALYDFGLNLGMAFQIQDDMLDLSLDAETGKGFANDLYEKKMTLPVIYFYQQADEKDRKQLEDLFKSEQVNDEMIKNIINLIKKYDGLTYAKEKMLAFRDLALQQTAAFPDNEFKTILINLLDYVVQRNK